MPSGAPPRYGSKCREDRATRELLRHLGLTWFLGGVYLRRLIEYRADFLIGTASFFVAVSVQAVTISIVFRQVPAVQGWRYEEVLFLLGFSLIPRGLDHLFTDNLWELGRKFVQRGEFFKYLIRPVNPLFYLISERFFHADGLGQLLAGISITTYAAAMLDLHLSIVKLAAAAGFVVCGAMIYMAIKLAFASLAFWTVVSLPAMAAVYELASFVKYPLDIYHGAVRMLLTWVIPFAFTAYVPVIYLLFDRTDLVLWTPLVAVVSLAAALVLWQRGLIVYEATGS